MPSAFSHRPATGTAERAAPPLPPQPRPDTAETQPTPEPKATPAAASQREQRAPIEERIRQVTASRQASDSATTGGGRFGLGTAVVALLILLSMAPLVLSQFLAPRPSGSPKKLQESGAPERDPATPPQTRPDPRQNRSQGDTPARRPVDTAVVEHGGGAPEPSPDRRSEGRASNSPPLRPALTPMPTATGLHGPKMPPPLPELPATATGTTQPAGGSGRPPVSPSRPESLAGVGGSGSTRAQQDQRRGLVTQAIDPDASQVVIRNQFCARVIGALADAPSSFTIDATAQQCLLKPPAGRN
jgi:hypothetical protein